MSLGPVFKFMSLVLVHVSQNYVNKFKYLSYFKSTVLLGRLEVKSFLKTGKQERFAVLPSLFDSWSPNHC